MLPYTPPNVTIHRSQQQTKLSLVQMKGGRFTIPPVCAVIQDEFIHKYPLPKIIVSEWKIKLNLVETIENEGYEMEDK